MRGEGEKISSKFSFLPPCIIIHPRIIISYASHAAPAKKNSSMVRTYWSKVKNSGTVLLSHTPMCSTIAAEALNYRVREGNVCFFFAMGTGNKIYNIEKFLNKSLSKGINNT